MTSVLDLVIVGGGPCGIACGIAAEQAGLDYVVFERRHLAASVSDFPVNMRFFSSADLLELGGVPFVSAEFRPTRAEFLRYLRRVVAHFGVRIRSHHNVERIEPVGQAERAHPGETGNTAGPARFRVFVRDRYNQPFVQLTRAVVLATGYFDSPNRLGVPGEDLPHVSHYYREAHPYFGERVVIVGGANSAVEAALELYRNGAQVTLVHRGSQLSPKVKPWIRPDIEARLAKGEIPAFFNSTVTSIDERGVNLQTPEGPRRIECEHVLLMTGYRPDHRPLAALGVPIDPVTGVPFHNPETMETNVPGLYLAGVLAAGYDANVIFIENGRHHGDRIVKHLLSTGAVAAPRRAAQLPQA